MKAGVCLSLILLSLPAWIQAQSSHDLGSRIHPDGIISDYNSCEWVLDETTSFPEPAGDSRWGRDNDIRRIAVTWDDCYLYIAADCIALNSYVILLVDIACGGPTDLQNFQLLRRSIEFSRFTPNVLVWSRRNSSVPEAALMGCESPPELLAEGALRAVYKQGENLSGALEVAIPWELMGNFERLGPSTLLPERGQTANILALVTRGEGTGSGDAAPDPSLLLENDASRVAVLDNFIRIPLDADEDRLLDIDVNPRDVARFALAGKSDVRSIPGLRVVVEKKLFSPESGEKLKFRPEFSSQDYPFSVNLSARIYSSAGTLVRVIYRDEAREPSNGFQAAWDEWDGRDSSGQVLPGGIYILTVSGALGSSRAEQVAKAAVAVIR